MQAYVNTASNKVLILSEISNSMIFNIWMKKVGLYRLITSQKRSIIDWIILMNLTSLSMTTF